MGRLVKIPKDQFNDLGDVMASWTGAGRNNYEESHVQNWGCHGFDQGLDFLGSACHAENSGPNITRKYKGTCRKIAYMEHQGTWSLVGTDNQYWEQH